MDAAGQINEPLVPDGLGTPGKREAVAMEQKKEALVLAGMCAVSLALSLAGLVWVFLGGMGFTLDAIFLILVCLAMAGLFSLMLFLQLKSAGLLPSRKKPPAPGSAG